MLKKNKKPNLSIHYVSIGTMKLLTYSTYSKFVCIALLFFSIQASFAQSGNELNRLHDIKTHLDTLGRDVPGLLEKVDFNINNTKLSDFVRVMADMHNVNISIDNSLNKLLISNNFSNATVRDVLVYLSKEYSLTIDFTGNILSLKKYNQPKTPYRARIIPIEYDVQNDLLTIHLKKDTLSTVFKNLVDLTGKNMVYAPSLENQRLSGYFKNMEFHDAIDKLAYANNLEVTLTRDNVYLFEPSENVLTSNSRGNQKQRPVRKRNSNFYYKILDTLDHTIEVDFENTNISDIINNIGIDLNINMFTTSPLKDAGTASVKAKKITFDMLLNKIFENTNFTYHKQDNFYYFGKSDQISLRSNVVIPLQHRSIQIMSGGGSSSSETRNTSNNTNYRNQGSDSGYNNQQNRNTNSSSSYNSGNNRQNLNTQNSTSFGDYSSKSEALVNILPSDVIKDLEVKTDLELNSFIVSGPTQNIERFRKFIDKIDKPVPVILIEVMFIAYSQNASIETGINWGMGNEPTETLGSSFPVADMQLGAETVNKIIGGFNGFGSLNLGKVVPNFYANIKALENNGDVDIRSTPKLSTLNGHRANMSIGERTYYVVTNTDYIGSQIPQTTTITNYQPIDAEMALDITPFVSGDNNITLDISVLQSTFNGERIDPEAPPGQESREFTSTIRVKDQDVVILGGLEEKTNIDSGSGVPFLSKIPIIKWFFSSQKKEDSEKRLSILIKPTIIK